MIQRELGPDVMVAGTYDKNPFFSTKIYEVEFPNGDVKEYAAKIIAKNMLRQVDSENYSLTMMKLIIDYKRYNMVVIPNSDICVINNIGQKRINKTTSGCKLLVKWEYGSKSWIVLNYMKEEYPVERAKLSKSRKISNDTKFAWPVPYTLRKREVILSRVKARICHKYSIEMPTNINH